MDNLFQDLWDTLKDNSGVDVKELKERTQIGESQKNIIDRDCETFLSR